MCAFDLSSPSRQKLSLVSIQWKDSRYCHPIPDGILESLSNQDGDGNDNGKKAIGLDWQNNNSARTSRFLDISRPSLHGYNVKVPKFTFCRGREQLPLLPELWIQLQKRLVYIWRIKRDGISVWTSTNSLFKWRFRSRRLSLRSRRPKE